MRDEDFERLYSEHAPGLFGFLLYRTRDRGLTEDLLAETFERVLRAGRRFDRRKASEKTWIYTIALNRLRDHVRRRGAEERALGRVHAGRAPGHSSLERVEEREELQQALATLSELEREAIALRFAVGMSVPEIAHVTNEPTTTIEGRIYRGLRRLRDELRETRADEAETTPRWR